MKLYPDEWHTRMKKFAQGCGVFAILWCIWQMFLHAPEGLPVVSVVLLVSAVLIKHDKQG